jgi:hypothetical protein
MDRENVRAWLGESDTAMNGCWATATRLYDRGQHETAAYEIAPFIRGQIDDNTAPETRVMLSILRVNTRVTTYTSNNRGTIIRALQTLLRMVLPFQQHNDYKPEWAPADFEAKDVF